MEKNKRYNLTLSALMGFFLLVAPVIAHADWGFSMGDDGYKPGTTTHYDNIKKIEFFIPNVQQNAGITWSGQGVTNLSASGWTATKINPTYVLATGPSVGSLYWNLLFSGNAPSEFRLDYLVYTGNKNKPVYAVSMTIVNGVPNFSQGSGWVALDPKHLPDYNRNPVPLPPTVWLLGAGLVGAFVFRKKMAG
jgi:hypothetical protein